MSGGHFDYGYAYLDRYEGQMEDDELNELLVAFRGLLRDLEWYKSGDTDEEEYQEQVKYFKDKWLRGSDSLVAATDDLTEALRLLTKRVDELEKGQD